MRSKQIIIREPFHAGNREVKIPNKPAHPYDVIIQTDYSLISPGTELAIFSNEQDVGEFKYPHSLGYANIGHVIELGEKVDNLEKGDMVLSHTNHASHTYFDTRNTVYAKLPSVDNPELFAFARMLSIGMTTRRICKASPSDFVAVFGLGLVGNLASQLFKVAGMKVVGLEMLQKRIEIATKCGLESIEKVPIIDSEKILAEYTDGLGFHLLIDAAGKPEAFLEAARLARLGAEIFLVGLNWNKTSRISGAEILQVIFNKYLTVRSGWEWQIGRWQIPPNLSRDFIHRTVVQNHLYAIELIERKLVRTEELITHRLRPEEAQKAYDVLYHDKANSLGILFEWV